MMDLPGKENSILKQVVKFYENRQYKKGLKTCESILKKHPNSGETMSMKALFLMHLKPELKIQVYELVRQGIKLNMKSHISWHVSGIIYRLDRNYTEAIKCYRIALKYDKENIQIWRDLACLQLQSRFLSDHRQTRFDLLTMRPTIRQSWIALSIAYYLEGKFKESIEIIDTFLESYLEDPKDAFIVNSIEKADLYLYKTRVLIEGGLFQEAIKYLDNLILKSGGCIQEFDFKRALALEGLASISQSCHDQNQNQDSINDKIEKNFNSRDKMEIGCQIYKKLLNYNPFNREYFEGIKRCSNETVENLISLYPDSYFLRKEELRERLKNSSVNREFLSSFLEYFREIPAIFKFIKPIYEYSCLSISDLLTEILLKEIEKGNQISKEETKDNQINENNQIETEFNKMEKNENIENFILLLARHYCKLGKFKEALELIEENNLMENESILLLKAKIKYLQGEKIEAANLANRARLLDLKDRSLNSKAVKYLLRADMIEQAQDTIILFIKKDSREAQLKELVELQHQWYFTELALAHGRRGEWDQSKKYFELIWKFYQDFIDDQFDFHNYALRKMTLNSYIDLIRFEDSIFSEKNFKNSALAAVRLLRNLKKQGNIDTLVNQTKDENENETKNENCSIPSSHNNHTPVSIPSLEKDHENDIWKWIDKLAQYHYGDSMTLKLLYEIYLEYGLLLKCIKIWKLKIINDCIDENLLREKIDKSSLKLKNILLEVMK